MLKSLLNARKSAASYPEFECWPLHDLTRVPKVKALELPRGSQDLMKTAILKERRLELAQEAHRWDDLVRNNVAVQTMNAVDDVDLREGHGPVNYDMQEYEIFLPIPQREVNRNPNLTPSEGYNY